MRRIALVTFLLLLPVSALAAGRADRCEPHRAVVEAILAEHGVPTEYYWLMVAESGCRPGAVSKRGAVGFWQMMPATMHHYGCRHPEDLTCQTRAAARYLLSLQKRFPVFQETIAAWNMGGTNFQRRGRKMTAEARGLVAEVERLRGFAEK